MASGPLNPKGLGKMGGFNANIGADPFALRTVQGAAQHYAQQRAGRTLINSVLKGKNSRFSPIVTFNQLNQSSPNTVFKNTGLLLSDANISGTGVNKGLYKFASPFAPASTGILYIPITSFLATIQIDFDWAAYVTAGGIADFYTGLNLDVSWVLEDYDEDAVTYNNFAATTQHLEAYGLTQISQWALTKNAAYSGLMHQTLKMASVATPQDVGILVDTTGLTIYGILLKALQTWSLNCTGISYTSPTANVYPTLPETSSPYNGWLLEVPAGS